MYFRYFIIISPLKKSGALHLNKIKFSSPKDEWCHVWSKLAKWFWRRSILLFRQCFFSIFCNFFLMEKDRTLHLNKLESPSPRDALCQVWLKFAQWFCRRRLFLISSRYFCYFVIIFPQKRVGTFI